jgi:hypothetical protein
MLSFALTSFHSNISFIQPFQEQLRIQLEKSLLFLWEGSHAGAWERGQPRNPKIVYSFSPGSSAGGFSLSENHPNAIMWEAFQQALDRPVQSKPRLRKLMGVNL